MTKKRLRSMQEMAKAFEKYAGMRAEDEQDRADYGGDEAGPAFKC